MNSLNLARPSDIAPPSMMTRAMSTLRDWGGRALRRRSSGDYTEAVIQAVERRMRGLGGFRLKGPAAVEVVARAAARGLSDARVEGIPEGTLTPQVLATIASSVVTKGESLHAVYWRRTPVLMPVSYWYVSGSPLPDDWRYQCEIIGPTSHISEVLARTDVVHVLPESNPSRPWEGVTATQSDMSELAGIASAAMGMEHGIAAGRIIPMPEGTEQTTVDGLKADLKDGGIAMPPTTRAGGGDGMGSGPQKDWSPNRLGPEPTPGQVQSHADAESRLSAALGMHPSALLDKATAAAMREARRQFEIDFLIPLCRVVETEVSRVFQRDIRLRMPVRTDVVLMQARAMDTFSRIEGISLAEAKKLAGLD